jgi:chorismate mutase
VDRIDRSLLRLLRQRTSLSGEIGQAKRRHGAEIYVPDRERELLARVTGLAEGKLPPDAVGAIFREILSSSRAAQGQPPIGLLKKSAAQIEARARCHFGACDQFEAVGTWKQLAPKLIAGKLAIALLTGDELMAVLRSGSSRFEDACRIVGEVPTMNGDLRLSSRVFIIKSGSGELSGNRAVILIECKSKVNAVKNLVSVLTPIPNVVAVSGLSLRGRAMTLAVLAFPSPVQKKTLVLPGKPVGKMLGLYFGSDAHGG